MNFDTHTPHVDPAWADAFLLELRLRGVDGRRIGAALAEVEAHCAESGESAHDAFGEPTAYAVELAPPTSDEPQGLRRELATSALGLVGMLTTLAGVGAWQSGTGVEVTAGTVGVMLLVVLCSALIVRHADRLLRAVVRRWWVAVVGTMAPLALCVAILVLGRQTLLTVPAAPALVVGLLLLAANTAMAMRGPDLADPVVGPEGAGGAGTLDETAMSRGVERVGPWLFPVLTVLMAVPLLLL
jgi:hypothetical protein